MNNSARGWNQAACPQSSVVGLAASSSAQHLGGLAVLAQGAESALKS